MARAKQGTRGVWRVGGMSPVGLSVADCPASPGLAEEGPPSFARRVKEYYLAGELYDWATDPRRFEKVFHTLRARESSRVISRHASGSLVADVGCGTGLITRGLSAERIVGIDINRWNLQRAVGHVATMSPVQGDAERLPLRPNCFDLVVCTETLEHLVEPRRALLDMAAVLKPGGKLIGTVPSRNWVWKARPYLLSTCPGSEPFHNQFSLDEARGLLRLPGCRVLELFAGILGLTMFFVLQKDLARPNG